MAASIERRIAALEQELLLVDEPEDFCGCLITPRALHEIVMAVQGTSINPVDDRDETDRRLSMD